MLHTSMHLMRQQITVTAHITTKTKRLIRGVINPINSVTNKTHCFRLKMPLQIQTCILIHTIQGGSKTPDATVLIIIIIITVMQGSAELARPLRIQINVEMVTDVITIHTERSTQITCQFRL